MATVRTRRLLERAREDLREIDRVFPHTTDRNRQRIFDLLSHLWLEDANRRFGVSAKHVTLLSGLPERSGRWWVQHLVDKGYVRRLPFKLADTREVIPAHWRPTRMFARQLLDIIDAFDNVPASLSAELRLKRSRYLRDIDPARVGIGGASDYDHDIEVQKVLAALLLSERCRRDGQFQVEPRIALPAAQDGYRHVFDVDGPRTVIYQPDAELRESGDGGQVRRAVIEYERFQSRRDAWGHIENFCGWMSTMAFPFEPGVLRFVVDSDARARTYVQLLEAYADYALDHPEQQPPNDILLAVATVDRVLTADDPLDDRHWHRLPLPTGGAHGARAPVLHPADRSPYDLYFGRR